MRRTTGKIAKTESKKRWLDSLRDFVRGDADIKPIRIQPVRASAQPVIERTNKTSPLGNGSCLQRRQRLARANPCPHPKRLTGNIVGIFTEKIAGLPNKFMQPAAMQTATARA